MNRQFLLITDQASMKSSKYEVVFRKIASEQLDIYAVREVLKENNIKFDEEIGMVGNEPCSAFNIDGVTYFAIKFNKVESSLSESVDALINNLELHEKFVKGDEVSLSIDAINTSLKNAKSLVESLNVSIHQLKKTDNGNPLINEIEYTLKNLEKILK